MTLPRILLLTAALACAGGTGNAVAQKAADGVQGSTATPYTITDMRGRQVRLARVPQRIVSLLPR
jgi:iron complex transport system substrate-binding protein